MTDPWAASTARLQALQARLAAAETADLSHSELEDLIQGQGRELLRQLFQDRADLQTVREPRLPVVVGADGVQRTTVEAHARTLTTVFGDVQFQRLAYRHRGSANRHPADARLNLPEEHYSHGVRRLAAIEASQVSFAESVEGLREATHAPHTEVQKRQVEELAQRAAIDFDAFYAQADRPTAADEAVLALSLPRKSPSGSVPRGIFILIGGPPRAHGSFDGKGIAMRPEALRPATAAAAAAAPPAARLVNGEQPHHKRMAEVAAVFDVQPVPRTPDDILGSTDQPRPAPTASGKWLTASVVQDIRTVIAQAFTEAERRDPEHRRTWLALVDGNNEQLRHILAQARARHLNLVILLDFIHVLEYLWQAAHCFFPDDSPVAPTWVHEKALAILAGQAALVAAAVRRKATRTGLAPPDRKGADDCADYLLRKQRYLDYPTALRRGWPIATGVIEGACRHLVKDRMDVTGARWGLDSAEAVLKLRALRTNRDFDRYWAYHLAAERRRVHEQRYAHQVIPRPD